MARDFSARADIDSSNLVDFPDGRLRNSSPPASRNGTAVVEEVLGDLQQFFLKLLRDASITPNGNPDTDSVSQYLQGLVAKIRATTASTAQNGTVELATDAEVNAGTTGRVVTADGLDQRQATTTLPGLIEVATNTEVNSGVDSERAVTPSGLNQRTATTSRTGIIELATTSEVNAGSDNGRAITPGTLNASSLAVLNSSANVIRLETYDFPTWNMDTTSFINIFHGLGADWRNIVHVDAMVVNDNETSLIPFFQGGIINIFSDRITFDRTTSGIFDGAGYDSTALSRGRVSVIYLDLN